MNYEVKTSGEIAWYVRPAKGRITEIYLSLDSTIFWNDENMDTMIREITGMGPLIDAGFEILDYSCIDVCDEKNRIKFTFYGDMSKVEITQDKDCTADDLQEP